MLALMGLAFCYHSATATATLLQRQIANVSFNLLIFLLFFKVKTFVYTLLGGTQHGPTGGEADTAAKRPHERSECAHAVRKALERAARPPAYLYDAWSRSQ